MTENNKTLTLDQQVSVVFKKLGQDWLGLMALAVIIIPFVFLATSRPLNEYPEEMHLGLFITVVLAMVIMFSYLVYLAVGVAIGTRKIHALQKKQSHSVDN